MPYGGVMRQRISSQCLKAALRSNASSLVRTTADGAVQPDTLADLGHQLGIDVSIRSALIGERLLAPRLKEAGLPKAEVSDWADALMRLWRREEKGEGDGRTKRKGKRTAESAETEATADTDEKPQPIVVGHPEIHGFVTAAKVMQASRITPPEVRNYFTKDTVLRKAAQPVQEAINALRAMIRHPGQHAGLDGALFGRMATGVAVGRVDSCVHVPHSLTVHPTRVSRTSSQCRTNSRSAKHARPVAATSTPLRLHPRSSTVTR
jgi:hypothetical protein